MTAAGDGQEVVHPGARLRVVVGVEHELLAPPDDPQPDVSVAGLPSLWVAVVA
jgi:hypothetical protein